MPHETLDYRSVLPATPARPRRLISHAITAGVLCLAAMWFDRRLRFDGDEARNLPWIELSLILYGFLFSMLSLAHGGLRRGDRLMLAICLGIFLFTGYVAVFMPRGIHN